VKFVVAAMLALWAVPAYGDDLHEGHTGSLGARTDMSTVLQLKSDVGIFPYPGGPNVWGGSINATRFDLALALSEDQEPSFEQGRVQFIRWPHLHVLGIERDTRSGVNIGVEAIGGYFPVRVWGNIGARDWAIATFGTNVGYRRQLAHAGAQHRGHVGYTTPTIHLEIQQHLGERVQLRSFAEVAYTAAVGQLVGASHPFEHLLELAAGIGLYYDVTEHPPLRKVPRTDPASGEVSYTTVANAGRRWRIILIDVSGWTRPIDSISTASLAAATFRTGLSREY
jgi:hypothetical protein